MSRRLYTTAAVLLLGAPVGAWACSSCGCSLNSDWSSQGYTVGSGLRVDLRFDYFDQSELRSGTEHVSRADLEVPNEREIQRNTFNHNTTLGLDYAFSRAWGVNVQLPYFDRDHSTLAEGDSELSYSHTRGIGDVRVTARYQGWRDDASFGVLFGLKLATGQSDATFYAGPQRGEILDRGLQAGTGTVDALIGAYDFGNLGRQWDYFARAQVQQALDSHAGFRPGAGLNVDLGLRYSGLHAFVPQLQLNVRAERREHGVNADVDNSGSTSVYLSPGFAYRASKHWEGHAFVQLPVYERVNGLQLEPRVLYSIGVQYRM